jgi:hypothetical protein
MFNSNPSGQKRPDRQHSIRTSYRSTSSSGKTPVQHFSGVPLDASMGPLHRVRCPTCNQTSHHESRANAIRAQKHGCANCNRGVGVVRAVAADGGQE